MARFIGRRVLNLRSLSTLGRLQLVMRFPAVARLSYRLFLDPRVSTRSKVATLSVVGLVLSPIDLPGWVPVLGQAADALVIVNVLDVFIKAAPRHVVQEHIRALGLQDKLKV
jgi:uncharacterized membrane protein YkvA (DUF1232 family)